MSDANEANRAVDLRSNIFQILQSLLVLENSEPKPDSRSYTTSCILDALITMEQVIVARIGDGVDDWKNDHKRGYSAIFDSIKSQIQETIVLQFSDTNRKTLRFVHTFNTLLVERFIDLLQQMGPSSAADMASLMIMELTMYVTDLDEEAQQTEQAARLGLDSMRANQPKVRSKPLSTKERLYYIQMYAESYTQ